MKTAITDEIDTIIEQRNQALRERDEAQQALSVLAECLRNIAHGENAVSAGDWTGAAAQFEVAASKLRSLPPVKWTGRIPSEQLRQQA